MNFLIFVSATDDDFYSSLAQMAGDGFDDDDDDNEVMERIDGRSMYRCI